MAYTAAVLDSQIDVSDIRDLLVQGDAAFPTINFTLPATFTGLNWRVRGTFMQFNLATQSDPLSVTEGQTAVTVAWSVGSNFTTYYGEMQIVLIGTDALGNLVTKATGYVNVQRDFSISTVEIVDENLFEQLMAELSSSSVMLDQTTEQEIVKGVPKLAADRVISDDHHIVDKKHVADVVAAVTADDFNHNDLANKQGGTTNEFYHVTAAEKTVIEHTSGTNTGDQDVDGAISAHNTDAGAHAGLISGIKSVIALESSAFVLPQYDYHGLIDVLTFSGNIYTGTANVAALLNLFQGTFSGNGLTCIINGTNVNITGTASAASYLGLNHGAVYSSTQMNALAKSHSLPTGYIFQIQWEITSNTGVASFIIKKVGGGNNFANAVTNAKTDLTAMSDDGEVGIYIASGSTVNFNCNLGLFPKEISDSKKNGWNYSEVSTITSAGLKNASGITWSVSTLNSINKAFSIAPMYGREGKKIAWFGDSISMLRQLPHRVGGKCGYDIYDCSFSGAPLSYSSSNANYEALGFRSLSASIIANNFSSQDAAITALGNDAGKRENLTTLSGIAFSTIDFIVILAGTNDFGGGYKTAAEVASAFDTAVSNLMTAYPRIKPYFISPTPRFDVSTNSKGETLQNFIDAIKVVCIKYAIPFYDLYSTCGINSINKAIWLNSDQLHPTIDGDKMLATKIAQWISSN